MLRIDFRVKGEFFAVPARRAVEVIPYVRLRPVAPAPPGIAGLFVYRGHVTPVVDLSLLIAGEPCPGRLSSRIIVCELRRAGSEQKRLVGLLAEGVTAVSFEPDAPLPALAIPEAPFLGGLTRVQDRMIQFVEPEALLPASLHEVLLLGAQEDAGENGENSSGALTP